MYKEDKSKVLMISKYYHPHVGGVERHIQFLIKSLKRQKKDLLLTILTSKHDNNLPNFEKSKNVRILRISYPNTKLLGLIVVWYKMFLNTRMVLTHDIIHIHDVFIWYLPLKLIFFWKPTYITFHGYESYPIPIKALIIRKIAEILTNGNISIGRFIGKWYKTKADVVSYGAVNLLDFKPRNSINKYDAIFVSRLDEHTGIITYLDTVQRLKDRGVDFNLLVLGEGKYYEAAEKTATVKGFVEDPERYYKYAQFAFVSRYLAILEAFTSRKLVFAVYDNPIKKDYLTMTPYKNWIIIEKDADKLANKVEYYKNNPKKAKEKIDLAYKWVQKQTWDKMSNNYIKLWGI